jgi:DNA-binding NarL/FixJ family response regulator
MPTIGIIDDEARYRDSDVRNLNLNLPKGWTAIGISPFPHMNDYPSWMAEHDIAVLLIDEELGRQSSGSTGHVDYKGHDLVQSLRQRNKTIPMYFLTNYAGEKPVTQRVTDVEGIIEKKVFRRNRIDWIKRITRKGKEYFNSVKEQLAQLNDLSLKIAKGEATEEDKKKAKAIQTSLELPLTTESFSDRSEWIAQYEEKVKEFEDLKKEIEAYLKPKSRKKKR